LLARRRWTQLALVALLGGLAGPTVATDARGLVPGERRVSGDVALVIRPERAIPGEKVRMEATVSPGGERRVVLQRRDGRRWVKTSAATTTPDGVHAFTEVTPRSTTTYRVVAPRTSADDGTLGRAVSPRRTLTAQRQVVLVKAPTSVRPGQTFYVVAEASPHRPGRSVVLQRRVDRSWTTVAVGAQDYRGLETFQVPAPRRGTLVHRVVVRASSGASAVRSLSKRTTVER
jgi:hypothetical protein